MTPQMIADILAIKTKDGDRVFDWGGSWETIKDAMHFELDIGPSKLASGIDWSTVKGGADAAAGGVGSGTATDGAPASEDNANLKAYTVSSRDGLRLRAGSGTEFEVRAVMPYGTVIYELRREGKWSIIDRTGDGIADGSANNSFLTRTPDSDQPATGTLVPVGGGSQGSETASDFLFLNSNYTATDLQENPSLAVYLDVDYKPHKGWQIKESPGRRFTVTSEEIESPIAIGKSASYRYGDRGLTTVGLGRPWYDGTPGHVKFDPADWNEQFNSWPELLYPTAYAESGADFSVINAWDLAGFTVGFIQLAAHTSDDLIPFFKLLVASLAPEAEKYFPEFMLADGELCYRRAGGYRRLEVRAPAADPVPNDLVDRGLFMSFFNKDRQSLGQEELHAAARWLAWTQESVEMRRLQVSASIDNMRDSLSILHRALLEDARTRYPKGVDGMRCDHLAHLIHEAEGEELTVGDEAVGLA